MGNQPNTSPATYNTIHGPTQTHMYTQKNHARTHLDHTHTHMDLLGPTMECPRIIWNILDLAAIRSSPDHCEFIQKYSDCYSPTWNYPDHYRIIQNITRTENKKERKTMEYCRTSWNTMESHGKSWKVMESCRKIWNILEYGWLMWFVI